MAENIIVHTLTLTIITSLMLFFVAAIAEIGGGYLVWKWIREKKELYLGWQTIISHANEMTILRLNVAAIL